MTAKGASKAASDKVAHDFTFRKIDIKRQEMVNALTNLFLQVGFFIVKNVDESADRTRAIEKLQESKFWAAHAITHYPHNESKDTHRGIQI